MRHTLGELSVKRLSAELDDAINVATFSGEGWDLIPALLSNAMPGSFAGLWNMNFRESNLNFQSWANVDPGFAKSYGEYFAHINPWTPYWTSARSGHIALSEEACPARLFTKTEFYNDWLRPQRDAEAGAGLKLLGGREESIQLVLHFPLHFSDAYGQAAAEVLTRIRGSLKRSISLANALREKIEKAVSAAALVERTRCAAFVIDRNRSIHEANPMAVKLFSSGQFLAMRKSRCFLKDDKADSRFGWILDRLCNATAIDDTTISFRTPGGAYQITLAALPTAAPRLTGSLLSPRSLFLVLVTELTPVADMSDFPALSNFADLTQSEILFCRRLLLGESISEAARKLGISVETARSKIKVIFQKTGTSRQGQLMLLLSKLR